MNRISGYRNMIGLTQEEMAKKLGITEGTYRRKEKGLSRFKDTEIIIFYNLIRERDSNVKLEDIFFAHSQTKKDEKVKEG